MTASYHVYINQKLQVIASLTPREEMKLIFQIKIPLKNLAGVLHYLQLTVDAALEQLDDNRAAMIKYDNDNSEMN